MVLSTPGKDAKEYLLPANDDTVSGAHTHQSEARNCWQLTFLSQFCSSSLHFYWQKTTVKVTDETASSLPKHQSEVSNCWYVIHHLWSCAFNPAYLLVYFYFTFLPQFCSSNLQFYQQNTMANDPSRHATHKTLANAPSAQAVKYFI